LTDGLEETNPLALLAFSVEEEFKGRREKVKEIWSFYKRRTILAAEIYPEGYANISLVLRKNFPTTSLVVTLPLLLYSYMEHLLEYHITTEDGQKGAVKRGKAGWGPRSNQALTRNDRR
jgi:hypothetical protein